MNLYKVTTIGLITGLVIACGAAGSDPTSVARADDAGAGSASDCVCAGQPGPQGEPGAQGPAGPAGKDAVCAAGMGQCPPGVAGPAGADGAKGSDGSSCSATGGGDTVQIACTNGTMATLTAPSGGKGDKGDKGDTGVQGLQGPPGETGAPGKDGNNGVIITKSSVYMRTSGNPYTGASAKAYCDDANDVVLSGSCVQASGGMLAFSITDPLFLNDPQEISGWQCGTNFTVSGLQARVICLAVP